MGPNRSMIRAGVACIAICSLAAAAPAAMAGDTEIAIQIKDHHFVPGEVSAPVGQRIKFTVRNDDASPSEFESVDFHREKIVQSGHEIVVYVGPLDAGSYEFFDDFHPDNRGHLTVK